MKLRKLFGFLLILAAAAGFIFSVAGLYQIWRYRPAVIQTVTDTLALFDQTLKTTQDGLIVISQVVQTTTVDVASLQTTTQVLAKTIHDTNPMLDSLTTLSSKDFPAGVDATQTSLASAQSSALLIDNIMVALTNIPFLPLAAYKPDVPLHTALAQVSTSMDTLKPALETIASSLVDGKANLSVVEVELNTISETTKGISTALASAQTVVEEYQEVTAQLKERVESSQRVALNLITTTIWILTFVLGWFILAQLGFCVQGFDMLRDRREAALTDTIREN